MRNGGVWTFQAYLKASNPGAGDLFGEMVGISGNTIVIGARYEDGSGAGINPPADDARTEAGAAYVFTRSGTVWTQQAYVKADSPWLQDYFGAVAVSGDTMVVGAHNKAGTFNGSFYPRAGKGFVFTRSGAVWSQQAVLAASNEDSVDYFGQAVAIHGDTVIIGAPHEAGSGTGVNPAADDLAAYAGAAYVFSRSGSVWSQQAYVKASNTGPDDRFGAAVAVHGDTIVIGATGEDGGGAGVNPTSDEATTLAGAAYVFTRSSTVWSQQAYLKATNPSASKTFGYSVALYSNTLLIGATGDPHLITGVNPAPGSTGSGVGAGYLFLRNGSTWTADAYLKAAQSDVSDYFGSAVGLFGSTAVIGGRNEDGDGNGVNPAVNEAASGAGSVEVFSGINAPEIGVMENATAISDGSTFPLGDVLQGATTTRTFTVSNSGDAPLMLSGNPRVTISGVDAALFSITTQPAASVTAGGSTTFTVQFTATTAGLRSAQLTLINDDADESIFRIQLSAEVLPPDIAISQQGLNIPSGGSRQVDPVSVGQISDMTFDITNTGAATLLLTGSPVVSISGPDAASFSILVQPNATVPTGVTRSFALRFTPLDGALKNALLTITSNDADESPYQIAISGQAPPPEIQVTQGSNELSEGSDFGGVILGDTLSKQFTIANIGGVTLNLTGQPLISLSGPNANSFSIDQPGTADLPPGGETTFTVSFSPSSLGTKQASMRILSNDAYGNSTKAISLQGTALNFTNDTDGDGLNDGSELQMAALGFKWNLNQPVLVNTLMSNASNAGLYTTSQVQALNVGTPLIQKNATTGVFTLTLGLEKSTNLSSFTAFPMTAPHCVINGQGKLEFQFTVPGNAAFFRVEAQ